VQRGRYTCAIFLLTSFKLLARDRGGSENEEIVRFSDYCLHTVLSGFIDGHACSCWRHSRREQLGTSVCGEWCRYIDKMEILWLANSDFETPAFKNFSSAAWTNLNLSSLYAIASGPDSNELYFDIWFNGETQAASFLFRSSHEGVVIDFAQATKAVGGGWVFITPTTAWDTAYSAVMPEPGTMLLLGFGLIGLAGFVFCRKK